MKRAMLVAFLAMVLPTAGLATSFDFSTGNFVSGTLSGTFSTSVTASVTGSTNINVSVVTGDLTQLGRGIFTFTDGIVTVLSGGTTLFTDALASHGNTLTVVSNDAGATVTILAALSPSTFQNMTINSGVVRLSLIFNAIDLSSGNGLVTATPESGTLGLLGTGLIGLAGLARRSKLKQPM